MDYNEHSHDKRESPLIIKPQNRKCRDDPSTNYVQR